VSENTSKNWWGAAWIEKMERLAESSRFKEEMCIRDRKSDDRRGGNPASPIL